MEASVGRGRGRGRGGMGGEGGEMADLRRPHVPPDLTTPGPHLAREDAARSLSMTHQWLFMYMLLFGCVGLGIVFVCVRTCVCVVYVCVWCTCVCVFWYFCITTARMILI